jgi:hypothetical protein
LHALYSRSFIQGRKRLFLCRRGVETESPPLWRPAYTCLTVFLCPPVSLIFLSLLIKGEESVVLCGDLLTQCLAYTCLTVSSCPPVSLIYLSLSLSKGKRASTSVETCLHLSNCLCLSTCLSNLPVSLCKF